MSIYCRSVLLIPTKEFLAIQKAMPQTSEKQKVARKNYILFREERAKLEELQKLLELFEWVTNEFQSNRINISRYI